MKHSVLLFAKFRALTLVALFTVTVCAVPSLVLLRGQDASRGDRAASTGREHDPTRVLGSQACVKCHEQESLALREQRHFKADERMSKFEGNTKKYCEALGIDAAQLKTDVTCGRCHGTTKTNNSGRVRVISGVSCESCHSAAGGLDGWLNAHSTYGPAGTTIDGESAEHREMRFKRCEQAGMVRPGDLYALATKCYRCHVVDNPKLVAAGHPVGSNGFELVGWTAGEVRHNFHQNRAANADAPTLWTKRTGLTDLERKRVKFVVGTLVELEVCLRNRAKVTDTKDMAYATALGGKIAAINAKLAPISAAAPETVPVADLIRPMLARLFVISDDDAKDYTEAADRVGKVTQEFVAKHDGSKLAALDQLISASPAKGKAFKP